jgi:hypothetical protein
MEKINIKRLSKEEWSKIEGLIKKGIPISYISKDFNITSKCIYDMAKRKKWKLNPLKLKDFIKT